MATGDKTSAHPRTIDGATFYCYHTGILKSAWRTTDGRCVVEANSRHTAYYASVDGSFIYSKGQRCLIKQFRKQTSAMKEAVKIMKGRPKA